MNWLLSRTNGALILVVASILPALREDRVSWAILLAAAFLFYAIRSLKDE